MTSVNLSRTTSGQLAQRRRSSWDLIAFAWLGGRHKARPNTLLLALTLARSGSGMLLVLLLLAAWMTPAPFAAATMALLLCGATQYLGKRLAHLYGAPRPYHLGLSPNHLKQGARGGWPSSHALSMACACGALLVAGDAHYLWWLMIGVSATTGWARVYAGAHFPSDVLVGWAWGFAAGCLGMWVAQLMLAR